MATMGVGDILSLVVEVQAMVRAKEDMFIKQVQATTWEELILDRTIGRKVMLAP